MHIQCPKRVSDPISCPLFCLYTDYPYCLTGKELKGVIKGLIGRCSDVLPDLFDHCIYTMLRELDRQSGTVGLRYKGERSRLWTYFWFRNEKRNNKTLFLSVCRRTSAWLQSLHSGDPPGQTQNSHPKLARGKPACALDF